MEIDGPVALLRRRWCLYGIYIQCWGGLSSCVAAAVADLQLVSFQRHLFVRCTIKYSVAPGALLDIRHGSTFPSKCESAANLGPWPASTRPLLSLYTVLNMSHRRKWPWLVRLGLRCWVKCPHRFNHLFVVSIHSRIEATTLEWSISLF